MSVLQKRGFLLGLGVAVALMVPFIHGVDPEPTEIPKSTEQPVAKPQIEASNTATLAEAGSESVAQLGAIEVELEETAEQATAESASSQVQEPETEVTQTPQAEVPGTETELTAVGPDDERLPPVAVQGEAEITGDTVAAGDLPSPDHDSLPEESAEPAPRDRFFGPFASSARAKRFALTVSKQTGLKVETEKQAGEGWYVTVAYRDETQRMNQRRAIADATGLALEPAQ